MEIQIRAKIAGDEGKKKEEPLVTSCVGVCVRVMTEEKRNHSQVRVNVCV